MDAKEVIGQLKIEKGKNIVESNWAISSREMPKGGPAFLKDDVLNAICRDLTLNPAATQALVGVARRTRDDAHLRAFAWHLHHCLYRNPNFHSDYRFEWPEVGEVLGDDAGRFYALVLVSNQPRLKALYREREVPEDVGRHTLEVPVSSMNDRDRPATIGAGEFHWLSFFMRGDIFRLGRLQFQYGTFTVPVRAFRHRRNGTVLAVSEKGIEYRSDGGAAAQYWTDEPDIWTSKLTETDREIVGNPIHPDGRARQSEVRLDKGEWAQALGAGDPMLAIHIPGGGKMGHDLCGESFRRALEFFPRHFPERPFKGFDCHSWMFDRQIKEFVPPTSNLVRLQQEVYVLPTTMAAENLPDNIIGGIPDDLSKAPRNTTFQRAMVKFLESGGKFRPIGGACFLLKEDFNWGGEVYLKQGSP